MAFYCNGLNGICKCDILCADCVKCDNTGGKEVYTNGDRIRAMSDDELSDYLAELASASNNGVVSDRPEEWLEWLQQPAEEG